MVFFKLIKSILYRYIYVICREKIDTMGFHLFIFIVEPHNPRSQYDIFNIIYLLNIKQGLNISFLHRLN